ncbi:unnamed protein product [Gordionus sp. m RMFG-2023]
MKSFSLQTFAIPGSLFLNVLSGYLYSFPLALLLVCTCSSIGASLCYFLSNFAGKKLINYYFPNHISDLSAKVNKHRSNILNYIIFLRITPILPNWLINLVCPILNIPLKPYFIGTFLGVAPPSILAIQMGKTLLNMTAYPDDDTNNNSIFDLKSMAFLLICALFSLLPLVFKHRFSQKFD